VNGNGRVRYSLTLHAPPPFWYATLRQQTLRGGEDQGGVPFAQARF
jgi:hypothetical protein